MLKILNTTLNGTAKMNIGDILILLVFPYIISITVLLQKPVNKRLDRLEAKFDKFIFGGFEQWRNQDVKKSMEKSVRRNHKNVASG